MKKVSPILQDLIAAFKQLPGIGIKSAQRIVFYLLENNNEKTLFLAETLNNSLASVRECTVCRMYSEEELCEICKDNKRDQNTLCIVETPADLLALENTMQFNGRYFVLMGHLSPIDGIGPEELKINADEFIKQKVIAFAGIGNPNNFFDLLEYNNINPIEKIAFPDHYKYSKKELESLANKADNNNAILLTTEKDYLRINSTLNKNIKFLKIKVEIKNRNKFIEEIKKFI